MEKPLLLITHQAGDEHLVTALLPSGFSLLVATDVKALAEKVVAVLFRPDYLLEADIRLMNGIAAEYPELPLILLCDDTTEPMAILRLDQPAWDFFNTNHPDLYWFAKTVNNCIRRRKMHQENIRKHREANEAQDYGHRLLLRMSHEIRTPLNAIIGMTEMLLDTKLSSKQLYYAQTIYESGSMLAALFNDILDYSKIEAGTIRIHDKPFNIFDSMRECIQSVAAQAIEKRLELISHIDPRLPQVFTGDDLRVRQIVTNLLDNAVKFTTTGLVKLRVYADQLHGSKHLIFEVSDTGPGIRKEVLPLLFKPYVQSETETKVQKKGVGLGLAIVDNLVKRMEGSIWVESELGLGSVFRVALPYRPADESKVLTPPECLRNKRVWLLTQNNLLDAVLADYLDFCGAKLHIELTGAEYPMLDHILPQCDLLITHMRTGIKIDLKLVDMVRDKADKPHILIKEGEKPNEKLIVIRKDTVVMLKPADMQEFLEVAEAVLLHRADVLNTVDRHITLNERMGIYHPLDILVAEDNAINQRIILTILNRYGYQPKMVENGKEALESLERRIYDVVLMDIQMPVMDGMEATRKIRQSIPQYRQPAIFALTADALLQTKNEYLSKGFTDVLYKPVQTKTLLQLLAQCKRIERMS